MRMLMVTGVVLFSAGVAAAQQPTLSDIAACNEQAAAKTAPSALPGPDPRPRTPERAREAPPPSGKSSEKTDPSGGLITQSPDPLVIGMDAGRATDPAYRTAYRQCMERRATGR